MPQKDSTVLFEEHEYQTRGSGFGVRRAPKQAQGGASSERCKTLIVSFIFSFFLQGHYSICVVHARFSEFGRAVVSIRLEEPNSPLRYFGFHLDQAGTLKTMLKDMRSQVWAAWDGSTDAPPKTRPAAGEERTSAPTLEILAWEAGRPVWPSVLDTRFPDDTEECREILNQKKAFHEKYPVQARSTTTSSQAAAAVHPRAGGHCDYSLDGGAVPLDTTRELDLLAVKDADFTVNRLE